MIAASGFLVTDREGTIYIVVPDPGELTTAPQPPSDADILDACAEKEPDEPVQDDSPVEPAEFNHQPTPMVKVPQRRCRDPSAVQ